MAAVPVVVVRIEVVRRVLTLPARRRRLVRRGQLQLGVWVAAGGVRMQDPWQACAGRQTGDAPATMGGIGLQGRRTGRKRLPHLQARR